MLRGKLRSKKLEKPVDLHIHKGDTVMIMSGKADERGKTGEVLRTFPKKGQIVVKGIHVVTRATKPSQANLQGGLVKKEAPIPAGKAMPVCPSCGKPTRVRHARPDATKPRIRVCARCAAPLKKA